MMGRWLVKWLELSWSAPRCRNGAGHYRHTPTTRRYIHTFSSSLSKIIYGYTSTHSYIQPRIQLALTRGPTILDHMMTALAYHTSQQPLCIFGTLAYIWGNRAI